MFCNPANPICSTAHHMPSPLFPLGKLRAGSACPHPSYGLVGKPSPYSYPYLLITEWGADLISWGCKYMLYYFSFILAWEKRISTYCCMWYWWMFWITKAKDTGGIWQYERPRCKRVGGTVLESQFSNHCTDLCNFSPQAEGERAGFNTTLEWV